MKRTKEEAAATRKLLLDAGLTVMSQKGYAATRLEDIASEAKLTRGAVYWHFAGKAEIYAALLEQNSAVSGAIVGAAVAEGGSHAAIWRRIMQRLLFEVEHDHHVRAVIALQLAPIANDSELAGTRAARQQAGRALVAQMAQFVQAGVEAGELRAGLDPSLVVRSFLALQDGLIMQWLHDPDGFSLSASASTAAEVFWSGVTQ